MEEKGENEPEFLFFRAEKKCSFPKNLRPPSLLPQD